jgi:hypothetical protein
MQTLVANDLSEVEPLGSELVSQSRNREDDPPRDQERLGRSLTEDLSESQLLWLGRS